VRRARPVVALSGRQSRYGLVIVLVAGLAVAVVCTLYQGHRLIGGVLLFVGLSAMLCPLADAAVSRRAEFAADRFAADNGLVLELAAAPHSLDDGLRAARGWAQELLAHTRLPSNGSGRCARQPATSGLAVGLIVMPPSTSPGPWGSRL
jgi:Zn-dependent protease with chaperone function